MASCIHCGSELVDEANYCIICGAAVKSDSEIIKHNFPLDNSVAELIVNEAASTDIEINESVAKADSPDEMCKEVINCNIPSIEASVTEMLFFESGFDEIPRDEWIYKYNFPGAETRYINWELRLEHEPENEDRSFELTYIYRDQDSHILIREKDHFRIYAHQKNSYHYLGWGWEEPGNWKVGNYSVELIVNDSVIARNFFNVM